MAGEKGGGLELVADGAEARFGVFGWVETGKRTVGIGEEIQFGGFDGEFGRRQVGKSERGGDFHSESKK